MRTRRMRASSGRFLGSLLAAWILGAGCAALPAHEDGKNTDASPEVTVVPARPR